MTTQKQPERIAAKDAVILWAEDRDTLYPTAAASVTVKGSPLIRDAKTYPNSLGAICMGWCEDDHPLSNPEGVFAHQLFWSEMLGGDVNKALRPWLTEYSKIEECEWARKMLAALEYLTKRWEAR